MGFSLPGHLSSAALPHTASSRRSSRPAWQNSSSALRFMESTRMSLLTLEKIQQLPTRSSYPPSPNTDWGLLEQKQPPCFQGGALDPAWWASDNESWRRGPGSTSLWASGRGVAYSKKQGCRAILVFYGGGGGAEIGPLVSSVRTEACMNWEEAMAPVGTECSHSSRCFLGH